MRIAAVLLALSALATLVTLNVFLLGRGAERHDPVGNLSPIAPGLGPIVGTSRPATTVVQPPRGGHEQDKHKQDD